MKKHIHKMEYNLATLSKKGWFIASCVLCPSYTWVTKESLVSYMWLCWKCNKPFKLDEEAAKIVTGAVCPMCRSIASGNPRDLLISLGYKGGDGIFRLSTEEALEKVKADEEQDRLDNEDIDNG